MRRNDQSGSELRLVHKPPVVRYTPNVFGFPDRLMCRLRYADTKTITSTSGVLSVYKYIWNSCYDPDYSSVGHQPLYYDTYSSIYDHYAVVKAQAKITMNNNGSTLGIIVGVNTDDDESTSSTYQTLLEQSHGVSEYLTPLSGSKSHVVFNASWDCAKILNIDPFTDQTYKTPVSSNPSETSFLNLWCITQDGLTTGAASVKIEIIYDVLFTELTTPTQS